MIITIVAVYLVFTFLFMVFGIDKHMAGIQVFLISLFLTPLVGLFYIYIKKNKSKKIRYYYCSECDYIYPIKMNNCPICIENGIKIKLKKYQSPYKVADKLGILKVA